MSGAEAVPSDSSAEHPLDAAMYDPLEQILQTNWDDVWRAAYVHARIARLTHTVPLTKPDPRDLV